MKRLVIVFALVVELSGLAQKEKESFLIHHINIGLDYSNYSKFKLNDYFSENQITQTKINIFGSKVTFTYVFKNNFGIYASIVAGTSLNKKNNQTNRLKMFRFQIGPSYRFIKKPNLTLEISPLYSNESMGVNLTFLSGSSVNSFLQNKSGNSLKLNRNSHYVGLNLSTVMIDQFTIDLAYSYNLNQSAFTMDGNTSKNTLPLERNGVFMVSVLTRIK